MAISKSRDLERRSTDSFAVVVVVVVVKFRELATAETDNQSCANATVGAVTCCAALCCTIVGWGAADQSRRAGEGLVHAAFTCWLL